MTVTITWSKTKRLIARFFTWIRIPLAIVIAGYILSPNFQSYWSSLNIDGRLLLDYVKVLASWPVILLVIFFFSKKYIPAFLDNVAEITAGKLGVKMRNPNNLVSGTKPKEISEGESIEPADDSTTDEFDFSILNTPEVRNQYELIYGGIYGSQLVLLKRLYAHIPTGLPKDDLMDLYNDHKEAKVDTFSGFSQFVQFLIDQSLALYDAEDKKYKITNAGVGFLTYLQETGKYSIVPKY